MDCMIMGDSLALGISRARKGCAVHAEPGVGSAVFVSNFRGPARGHVLISLGSNDHPNSDTLRWLGELRGRIDGQVTWILPPNNQRARDAVASIARRNGDRILDVRPFVGSDGVHPTQSGYFRISAMWNPR